MPRRVLKPLAASSEPPSLTFWLVFLVSVFFLGSHLQHMEVPRLGDELELHLPAYTTATATWDPKPLSRTRDQTRILMDTSRVR